MFYWSRIGHTRFLSETWVYDYPFEYPSGCQDHGTGYLDKTPQVSKSRRDAQMPLNISGGCSCLSQVPFRLISNENFISLQDPTRYECLTGEFQNGFPPSPLKFQKDFDLWCQYIFQTWIRGKIHFKNPSFNKLSDKLFSFFWWRPYTGKVFKKNNKEFDPVILIISIKARKELEWLFCNTKYQLTREVSQWVKTKNSGIKPNTIFNSALWWYFHCKDIQYIKWKQSVWNCNFFFNLFFILKESLLKRWANLCTWPRPLLSTRYTAHYLCDRCPEVFFRRLCTTVGM